MATVNFSVPDEIKRAFDKTFGGQNKSAIIAELMRKAVSDEELRIRRRKIFEELTRRRAGRHAATDRQIRKARISGRP